jgi:hypothetical protein
MRLALLVLLLLPWPVYAMPPAIIAAAIGVSIATAEMISLGITIASIAFTIGTTVYGAVAQKAAAKKAKRAAAKAREDFLNSLQDRTVTRIATEAPWRIVYGKCKVGSDVVAILVSGANEEYKHIVCIHAAHESEAIDEIYINGKALGPLDDDGFVTTGDYFVNSSTQSITETFATSPFTLAHTPSSSIKVIAYGRGSIGNAVGIIPLSGEVTYTRVGNTITVTGSLPAGLPVGWTFTFDHYSVTYQYQVNNAQVRVKKHLGTPTDPADASLLAECGAKWKDTAVLRGFTYTVIRLDLRQAEFQGGLPDINVLMRGKKLYDLRTGETAYSTNPALAIYDYLLSPFCNVPESDIPTSFYITAANVCDEVQTFGALYTLNGTVTADQDQAQILEAMADAMAGGIVSTTWEVFAGKYVAPIASLEQSDIVGSLAVTPGISDADIINGVRGQNITAENLYVATDYPPYQNATYLAADGRDKFADINFPFTDSAQRVHNLARIQVEDQRNGFTVKAEFSLKAWDIHVGDRVTLTSAFLGQTDKVYRVTDKSYSPTAAISLTLKEDVATIWDLADTVTLDDTPNTDLPNPFLIAPLSFVTCDSGTSALLIQQDGTIVSRIHVSWSAGLLGLVDIEWKKDSDTAWHKTQATGDQSETFLSPVEDGVWYIVRARKVDSSLLNVKSDWTYADLHQVVGKSAPPGDVENLSIDGSILTWTEVTDLDLAGYVFRYHYGNNLDWGTASPLHNGIVTGSPYDLIALPYGSVTIMGKALDTSGNESVNAAQIFTNLGDAPVANVVEEHDFHPTFAGTLTNCSLSSGTLIANAADSFYGDDLQSFYGSTGSFYKPAAGFGAMVYESDVVTISSGLVGSKITLDLVSEGTDVKIEYKISGEGSFYGADDDPFYSTDTDAFYAPGPEAFDAIDAGTFDSNNPNSFAVADAAHFDPSNPNSFLAVDLGAFSETGAFFGSYSPTWIPWPGQITAKNADYQFRVTIGSGNTQGKITAFSLIVDAPDIIEIIPDLAISASGTVVTYTKDFTSIKATMFGALQPGTSGARSLTIDKTNPLAPVVHALNISGVAVSGAKVDITLQGY